VTMTVHECSCAMGHRYCTLVLWLIGPLQRTSGSAGSINSPGIQWIGRTNEALLFKQSFLPFPVSLCPLRFESCCADGVEWVARPPLDALVSSDER